MNGADRHFLVSPPILARRVAGCRRTWQSTLRSPQPGSPSLALAVRKTQPLQLVRHASALSAIPSNATRRNLAPYSTESTVPTTPFAKLCIGAPRETYPDERRVALTPQNVALLLKKGFAKVLVEKGAGAQADFLDDAYATAGATLVDDASTVWNQADIVLKVRGPSAAEADMAKEGQTIISFLQPMQNKALVEKLAARKATAFAMDMIPRISRAQVFDALSSMANIAGYKAVLEAAGNFGRFFTGQVTAAGKIPPGKVLVIGAGVAGLSAIVTARRLGAIVRGFDTRSAAREQVQSLGAEFIEVEMHEEGSGTGGYAKQMSEEFLAAERKLFTEQAREVDIIITTALIPGVPAPKLLTKAMVEIMKPGSVIVDLAAEAGGNCEVTQPGKMIVHKDVKVIGKLFACSRVSLTDQCRLH
ncbi:hypothetical protein N0V88_001432 [Collariella sp. IMI 366227]|nr:hypothetical protein N0V88_001432 [Collariella sp. IMI 366227]